MSLVRIFEEDLCIAQSILKRDGNVTRDFLFKKCYPMFKSIFDNYYTDSNDVHEFICEIYLLILTPSKESGRCQLENYRGESSLATWLKSTSLFYCYHRYRHKKRLPIVELVPKNYDDDDGYSDRLLNNSNSTTINMISIEYSDLEAIIGTMSNERYRKLIRLRYLEQKSNEDTAEALGISMANYYNKHKLAKAQFAKALRQEFNN